MTKVHQIGYAYQGLSHPWQNSLSKVKVSIRKGASKAEFNYKLLSCKKIAACNRQGEVDHLPEPHTNAGTAGSFKVKGGAKITMAVL